MSEPSRGRRQIPLPFFAAERLEFDSFWTGPNHEAVALMRGLAAGDSRQDLHLWGETGSGRSHLLQAACNLAARAARRSAYVPLAARGAFRPELLDGLEQLELVCIDDVDLAGGDAEWERALFNLYNRLHERGTPLITAARQRPDALPLRLPDLASRLSASLACRLAPLDETQRIEALRHRAALRGLELPDEVVQFLARRVGRDMHTLFSWMERLDTASLAEQRKLTVPFVSALLEQSGM